MLEKRGYKFETDTDSEVAAVLAKYLWDSQNGRPINFVTLIKAVVKELEGAFAFVFKSVHFPEEVVVCKRGSPVLIGVKTEKKLKVSGTGQVFEHDSSKTFSSGDRLILWTST